MPIEGEYEPSPRQWVRDQVETYERTEGKEANTLRDTGLPIVVFTMRGAQSGKVRKVPLMRIEHGGSYAMIASQGGAPRHPQWYRNVLAHPEVTVQDGPKVIDTRVRELRGAERDEWWQRAVAGYPPYAEYQTRTERQIPVLVAEPVSA
jgi:deazaflavin-dependent oxidoreductase (nitroreductase family)